MSSFKGFIKEIPGIAVDYFEEECLQSQFLFLSHCHTDHMVGLSKSLEIKVPLFASEISTVFLRAEYPNLSNSIEPLSVGTPLHLRYTFEGVDYSLEVTPLPAKHCPGSVMFLFETKDHIVLYTGDFRICKSDFKKYDILRTKPIECVYLDSTFLSEQYYEFPTREQSLYQICVLIKEWLTTDPRNNVIIEMPAQYGIEFLFVGIQRKLKEKIYVRPSQWEKYIYFPFLDNCIESDKAKCRIIAQLKEGSRGHKQTPPGHVRVIKPTAMYWTNWEPRYPFVEKVKDKNEYRVAYSSHCSCSELKDFLEFVKPKAVSLNVIPRNCDEAVYETLLKIYNPGRKCAEDCTDVSFDDVFGKSISTTAPYMIEESEPRERILPKRLKM